MVSLISVYVDFKTTFHLPPSLQATLYFCASKHETVILVGNKQSNTQKPTSNLCLAITLSTTKWSISAMIFVLCLSLCAFTESVYFTSLASTLRNSFVRCWQPEKWLPINRGISAIRQAKGIFDLRLVTPLSVCVVGLILTKSKHLARKVTRNSIYGKCLLFRVGEA